MEDEDIEITLLHNPKFNEKYDGFMANVLINKKFVSILELSKEQMLHIGAILLNASNTFINNANKIKENG